MIIIINCYRPHSKLMKKKKKPQKTEDESFGKLVNKYENKSSVRVAGNMNATAGKTMNETCIEKNSKRYKNDIGDDLINFCQNNELLLTNT